MTRLEVAGLIGKIQSNYRNFFKNTTQEETTAMVDDWSALFAEIPTELVMKAYLIALSHCKYPVTPADIFEHIREAQKATQLSPEALWNRLLRAVRECRSLAAGFNYNAASGKYPGMTQGAERRKDAQCIFDQLPKEIQAYTDDLPRLISLGEMDVEQMERTLPAFRRFVLEYRKQRETLNILGSGSREAFDLDELEENEFLSLEDPRSLN